MKHACLCVVTLLAAIFAPSAEAFYFREFQVGCKGPWNRYFLEWHGPWGGWPLYIDWDTQPYGDPDLYLGNVAANGVSTEKAALNTYYQFWVFHNGEYEIYVHIFVAQDPCEPPD